MENGYGAWTLLPPLVAIVLCFITRRVLVSLFLGILTGGIVLNGGNVFAGLVYALEQMVTSIADPTNTRLLLFNLMMGAGIAFIWRLGGSRALTQWARRKIRSRRAAGVGAWLLGILIFFNDYVNAAIVGNVFRNITEKHRISTEKLSYVLDSTAAPVATFFISDWIAFQIGMVATGISIAGFTGISAFEGYLYSIPYNLYSILAVLFVGLIVISGRDYGPMLKAEHRAVTEGKIVADGATPMMNVEDELGEPRPVVPRLWTFLLPLAALVGVTLFGFWWTGRGGHDITEILGQSEPDKALLWGAFAMCAVGMLEALGRRIMTLKETMETLLDGMKLMLLACGILVLAWSLGGVTGDMKLADYIVSVIGGRIPFGIVPLLIFLTGMFISFSTGTAWGTMTILTPVAIPLTYQLTGDPYTAVIMAGVVFSGAIFGDHCSPISDTTVLASIFSGADHMAHVATQVPYAVTTAAVAGLMYVLFGFFGLPPLAAIPAGLVLLLGLLLGLSRFYTHRYGICSVTKRELDS